mgnify:CR=1 FL=1
MLLAMALNQRMLGPRYAVLYDTTTGYVYGFWQWYGAENLATAFVDGYLELGGEIVAEFGITTGMALVTIVNVGYTDTEAYAGVYEVNDLVTPTKLQYRTDGDKSPYYPYS